MKADDIKKTLKIYSYIVIALLVILILKLSIVQLFYNEAYQIQAKENRVRLVPIKAPRGEIYDRNNEILATNQLVYTLSLSYPNLSDQDMVTRNLCAILENYYPEVTPDFVKEKIELQKYRLFEPIVIVRDIPWELIVELEENRQDLPGVTVEVEPLRYYPNGPLAGHVLGYIHSISTEELAGNQEEDYKYSINSLIGKSGVEKQYEKQLRGRDGARSVEVDAFGRPVQELVTLEPQQGNNLHLTIDVKLQQVMQKSMETTLARLQARHPKARAGSAVLLNVKTGEVLAMCSYPLMYPEDWKGNLSSQRVSYYFPQGNSYDPMNPGGFLNRSIQVTYAPGSTFKPITGMAALEKEAIDPLYNTVNCKGSYWLAPYIGCWSIHGYVNYYSGMAGSCNTYFQEMGRRAGINELTRVAGEFGLGSKTGIDLPGEIGGLLPSAEWKKKVGAESTDRKYKRLSEELEEKYQQLFKDVHSEEERAHLEKKKKNEEVRLKAQYKIDYNFNSKWQSYDTFNMSIGEGYNSYTVLQLANYVAILANGGYRMEPYVVDRVSGNNRVIETYKPKVVKELDIKPATIAETRRAMLAVTQPGGTGYGLFYQFPENIQVAAKTGTAESRRSGDADNDYNGVFVAFAPFDDPEIAFAGVIEYGYHGSESAGLIAKDVFEQYFGLKDHLSDINKNNLDKASNTIDG